MPSKHRRVFFEKYVFSVDENVYEPAEDSFLLAEKLEVKAGDRVLDMGTGCGLLAIVAAEKASKVIAVDVNPHSVHCTLYNAEINNVRDKIEVIQGDLFKPLCDSVKFDIIMFNAPYLPKDEGEPDSWVTRAWSGGLTGRAVIDEFIAQSPVHVDLEGRLFLIQSSMAGVEETIDAFKANGMSVEIVAECSVPFFETIVLLKARQKN